MPGTQPVPMTRQQIHDAGQQFNRLGSSIHGPDGATLWGVLAYCELAKIAYTVKCVPGVGWEVRPFAMTDFSDNRR